MMLAKETDRTSERVEAGGVDRVRDGKIVGVKDEELGVDGIAAALGNVVGLGCEIQCKQRQCA
jgi:hypothetical protein